MLISTTVSLLCLGILLQILTTQGIYWLCPCKVNEVICLHSKLHKKHGENFQISRQMVLTLKAPITTAADDIHKYFFHFFSSARQRIHKKNQALFSSKDKSIKLKCRLLQFLYGALRI